MLRSSLLLLVKVIEPPCCPSLPTAPGLSGSPCCPGLGLPSPRLRSAARAGVLQMSRQTCGNARGTGCCAPVFVWQNRADPQANSMSAPTAQRCWNMLLTLMCSHL